MNDPSVLGAERVSFPLVLSSLLLLGILATVFVGFRSRLLLYRRRVGGQMLLQMQGL